MLTFLSFVIGIGALIAVHEYGHYRVAVACGVKILRFSVGFGKPVWSWKAGLDGTEFVIALFPLGGYVRMLDEKDAPVNLSESHRAFNNQPLRKKVLIVLAGPLANLFLTVAILAFLGWWGTPQTLPVISTPIPNSLAEKVNLRAGDLITTANLADELPSKVTSFQDLHWVLARGVIAREDVVLVIGDEGSGIEGRRVVLPLSEINAEQVDARVMHQIGLVAPFADPVIQKVIPGEPGASAGLEAGDWLIELDGITVADAQHARNLIQQAIHSSEQTVQQKWLVERNGRTISLTVVPRPTLSEGAWTGRVGIYVGGGAAMAVNALGILDSVARGLSKTWEMSVLTLKTIGAMATGEASLKNLGGPLTIANQAGHSAANGAVDYLLFLATVSVGLGVMNLLPIPILDGGHLMYYLYEALTGREVSPQWMEMLQRGGLATLMGVMALALFNDFARLLG